MNAGIVTGEKVNKSKSRYVLLDQIRGLAVLNMIAYHAAWDLVYLFGVDWAWYRSDGAYVWQQCICWTFIFLSGFCQPLGRKKLKRGLLVFLCGGIISFVTAVVMPQSKIIFGILTLIGSCMLLMIPLESLLERCRPTIGFLICAVLFIVTRNVNQGWLGFYGWNMLKLPQGWYSNMGTTFIGFPMMGFFSTDYFSLIPWFFLYVAGYFFYGIARKQHWLQRLRRTSDKKNILEFIGGHSLEIYMVHQVVIYVVLMLIF